MVEGPTPNEIAMKALWDARDKLRAKFGGIGEPCIALPVGDLQAYTDKDGELQVVLAANQFIYVVDRLLRS